MMTCWWQCDVQPGAGRSLPPTDVGPGAADSSWPSIRRCLTGRLLSCDEHANSPIGVLSRPTLRLTMPNCGWVPVTAACSSSLPYQSQQGGASGGRLDDSDQERHEVERATCGLAPRCCIRMLTYALNVVAEPCFTADLAMINATGTTSGPLPARSSWYTHGTSSVLFGGSRVTASTVTRSNRIRQRCGARRAPFDQRFRGSRLSPAWPVAVGRRTAAAAAAA